LVVGTKYEALVQTSVLNKGRKEGRRKRKKEGRKEGRKEKERKGKKSLN
jgi:hypothetical protein